MPSFTVQKVVGQEPWSKDGREFIGYELVLEELEGQTATLNQIPKTPAPKPGDQIEGDLEDGPRGKRLKKAYGGGSQRSSNGSSDDFARRPEHPRNEARMIHNSALSQAPVLLEQMLTLGLLEKPADKAAYLDTLTGIVKWVEDRSREALADQAAGDPPF